MLGIVWKNPQHKAQLPSNECIHLSLVRKQINLNFLNFVLFSRNREGFFLSEIVSIHNTDVFRDQLESEGIIKAKITNSDMLDQENLQEMFEPGSIHELAVRDFWKHSLLASDWVLKTLEDGYRIPFDELPGTYEEDNNASAKANMTIVKSIVADMIASKIIRVVKEKPICVSPLGLVSKLQEDGSTKHRLIFDASRWVNRFIKDQVVTLSHLEKALNLTERNDWQIVFDLKSAYYHIKICKEHQTFLGASITNSDGSKLFFVYNHLPFGLKCAVHAITKIWKPLIAFLQSKGMRSTIYIDDGRILASSQTEAELFRREAYEVIRKAGWHLEKSKSDGPNQANQTKKYLGFVIDTTEMRVTADKAKLEKLVNFGEELTRRNQVGIKDLAKLMGKMIALLPSHGSLARICTRSGYSLIDSHVRLHGWSGNLTIASECVTEIKFFLQNVFLCNGALIQNELTTVKIQKILPGALASKDNVNFLGEGQYTKIASDSSSFKAAVCFLESNVNQDLEFTFTTVEMATSSGMRELLAVHKATQHWIETNAMKNKLIYWMTDSTNVVAFLEKGSSRVHIQKLVFEIVINLSKLNSKIQPIHLFRNDERILNVDKISKTADSDDWSIDAFSFANLKRRYNLEVDLFASNTNARLPIYFSKFWSEGCAGVDAFAHVWNGILWICPPISLLPRIANEIRKRPCQGIIVIPDWPTSSFYCKFKTKNGFREPFHFQEIIRPYIYQNQEAKGPLCGKISFDLLVLYFNTVC